MSKSIKSIIKTVHSFLLSECKFHNGEKILVALSGGVDSLVLCEILNQLEINFAIAHCNFQLRGEESQGDAEFAKEISVKYGVDFFLKEFNTKTIEEESNQSIQMIARSLRYDWFEQIRKENAFHCIATAHHQNDVMETMIYNLAKGTGLAGLHGIRSRKEHLIRPLLPVSKEEIESFAANLDLKFRKDSSNDSTKYARNKIRHEISPVLKTLNPKVEKTFYENSCRILEAEKLYNFAIELHKKKLIEKRGTDFYISILKLKRHCIAPKTVLWEILKSFDFNPTQAAEVYSSLNGPSGKLFFSNSHRLIKDRKFLIISSSEPNNNPSLFIVEKDSKKLNIEHFTIKFQQLNKQSHKGNKLNGDNQKKDGKKVLLDFDKIAFPLKIRKWKSGDYFYPIGLLKKNGKPGKKKLKKYFSDLKWSLRDKENAWIMQDNQDKIVWIIGDRIDERFKLNNETNNVLKIRLEKFDSNK